MSALFLYVGAPHTLNEPNNSRVIIRSARDLVQVDVVRFFFPSILFGVFFFLSSLFACLSMLAALGSSCASDFVYSLGFLHSSSINDW